MDMKNTYITWNAIETLTATMIDQMVVADWTPTIVVGLTRGGLVPATMISHYFDVPMSGLDVNLRDNSLFGPTTTWIPEEIANGHRILIVDDINDTGATFAWIRDDWTNTLQFTKPSTIDWPWDSIKFGALIHNQPSTQPTDYYGMTIDKETDNQWVCFPWETWHLKTTA